MNNTNPNKTNKKIGESIHVVTTPIHGGNVPTNILPIGKYFFVYVILLGE